MKDNKLLNTQYLDNTYQLYYFIPYPECKFFDDMDNDVDVIPVSDGSFVNAEWIGNGCEEE